MIVTPSSVVHGRPLGADQSRVSIQVVLDPNALLPVPIGEEIITVGQAVHTMVVWPNSLILDVNTPVSAIFLYLAQYLEFLFDVFKLYHILM